MILYDQLINKIKDLLPDNRQSFSYEKSTLRLSSKNDILFTKDTAFELGGSSKPCVSTVAVTSTMHFENNTLLFGKDLINIKEDCPFGKIVLLEIDDIDEDIAFNKIKELENVRFNFYREGFMTRASALSMREQTRVSKKIIKQGVSFADYGSALIEEYFKNPIVRSACVIFITEFTDFNELFQIAEKIKDTTSALCHILDNVLFDCSTCNIKEICDEVDGMKEMHMKQSRIKK